jgi:tetratricopeptide (TPR) repeat protein
MGDLEQPIKLYEQAVALDPLRSNSYSGLGYLLYVAGRYDEAETALQKALDLNPQATYVHLTLDRILIAKGKPQQGLAEIEKEPSEWAKLTGQVLTYHGEFDRSLEWLDRAYKERDGGLTEISSDPLFKNLRHDPRYTDLLKKLHLPT